MDSEIMVGLGSLRRLPPETRQIIYSQILEIELQALQEAILFAESSHNNSTAILPFTRSWGTPDPKSHEVISNGRQLMYQARDPEIPLYDRVKSSNIFDVYSYTNLPVILWDKETCTGSPVRYAKKFLRVREVSHALRQEVEYMFFSQCIFRFRSPVAFTTFLANLAPEKWHWLRQVTIDPAGGWMGWRRWDDVLQNFPEELGGLRVIRVHVGEAAWGDDLITDMIHKKVPLRFLRRRLKRLSSNSRVSLKGKSKLIQPAREELQSVVDDI